LRKISRLIKKEFLQIKRDRAMRTMILVMPIMQLLLLGYVVSSEVTNIKTVICDLDNSPLSRSIVRKIQNSRYFDVRFFETRQSHIQEYLDSGRASVAVVFPQGLSKQLRRNEISSLQILMDGQDVNSSTIALGYLNGILEEFMTDQVIARLASGETAVEIHLVQPNIRIWYNPDLRNSDYMVPGIAIFLLTIITSLISAMGLVREREIGTLEQLLVAPIKKYELIIGKIIPFAIIGLFEMAIAVAFAKLWYHIPIVGNLALFFIFAVIYLFTTLGVGLFVSATAHTQQQAMFMAWFVMIFVFIMSGFMFPIENMPRPAQLLTYLNPMRYFIIVVRELFIKGAGLSHLYPQGIALMIFGGGIFAVAVARFQSRMR
jgi:ABC-2 type transport system permease protein